MSHPLWDQVVELNSSQSMPSPQRCQQPITLNLQQRMEYPCAEAAIYLDDAARETALGALMVQPCVGRMFAPTIEAFHELVSELWFVDLNAFRKTELIPLLVGQPRYELIEQSFSGRFMPSAPRCKSTTEDMLSRTAGCTEVYRDLQRPNRELRLHRQRQCAAEFLRRPPTNKRLGVFMHTGDSNGEGGSELHFLSTQPETLTGVTPLFPELNRQLRPSALVVTDGSNCDIKPLREYHRKSQGGHEVWQMLRKQEFFLGGRSWRCAGWLPPCRGPTLVWHVNSVQ